MVQEARSSFNFSAFQLSNWSQRKIILVSISPTFYEQLLRQNSFAKKLQTQIVSK
jgi:hypothetical protein